MTHGEIREKFLKFFESQPRNHKRVDSSSLLPDDPSVLFTTAGMQPMIPYLLGKAVPPSSRIANSQKCFRAQDIEEVGDNRHTTFFEMLGNWSFGDYWKEEQLSWWFEFVTEELGLDPSKLYVTVFSGGAGVEEDITSRNKWTELFNTKGIKAQYTSLDTLKNASKKGMESDQRIFGYGVEKNWWSRSGGPEKMATGEPGGPDSEMFYRFDDVEHNKAFGEKCHPNCDCGQFMEIGNSVFMEFQKREGGGFEKLPQRNVDFGGGLERMTAAANNESDIFKSNIFAPIIHDLEYITGKKYEQEARRFRIIADHLRAATHLIDAGVRASNKAQGYMLRRLIRRSIFLMSQLGFQADWYKDIVYRVIYDSDDTIDEDQHSIARDVVDEEAKKFYQTIRNGEKEINKVAKIDAKIAFNLYQNHGFPFELTEEIARERGQKVEYGEFRKEFEKHQEISKAGLEKKFGGHGLLLDTGELKAANEEELKKVTRLHTATHMLQAALRKVLGDEVHQAGSDITAERLRFDFSFARKMTAEEIEKTENIINNKIKEDLKVSYVELPIEEAKKTDALYFFSSRGGSASGGKEKYPDRVKVYSVGDFSKEFCGGPHVTHTAEIGQFKILKEEAVSTGTRRIRATVL